MVENSVVELLSPMTTFGNTDYDELAQIGNSPIVGRCRICCDYATNFSQTNPEYTSSNFLSFYPEFTNIISSYTSLFNTYKDMANHCLNYTKFGFDWYYLMSSFIAHYIVLTFQKLDALNTNTPSQDVTNAQIISALSNQSMGLAVRESLGGEEIQIENMISVGVNKSAGNFMTTPYGREFWDKYYSYCKNFFRGVY